MKETIGWIGVGSMGHRMSRHLAAAGYPLVVADAVSTERAPPGSAIARNNAEVAARADTVILSLPDGAVSEAVARELATAKSRRVKTVIDTSTIGIKAAEASRPSWLPLASSSSTLRCPGEPPAPTRRPSPSWWRARETPTSASSHCWA
jgi:prephenate dehydrogenase